ncbi:hypothetical protein CEXT_276501 [Caerostris extrusa]|uniref:Uncharacterized protein n=1 Tax=Caerostris extrusa TaxID=172846 RepID=A0AAV4PEY5_CAEEX|nr:hypothetical protein CEXT_276501 [Caerostris extrusa]
MEAALLLFVRIPEPKRCAAPWPGRWCAVACVSADLTSTAQPQSVGWAPESLKGARLQEMGHLCCRVQLRAYGEHWHAASVCLVKSDVFMWLAEDS